MAVLNDVIDIASVTIRPQRNDEVEGIGSGQILRAELTTPLWSVKIETPLTEFDTGRDIRAFINDANQPGMYFDVYDPIAQYPRLDPTGALLGSSTPVISNIDSSNGLITISGLPAGYKLSRGDFFQIDYGGRRGFYEISAANTASGSGVASGLRVFPKMSASVPLSTAVVLKKPMIRCQFVPDDIDYGSIDSSNWKMNGFSFGLIQKL